MTLEIICNMCKWCFCLPEANQFYYDWKQSNLYQYTDWNHIGFCGCCSFYQETTVAAWGPPLAVLNLCCQPSFFENRLASLLDVFCLAFVDWLPDLPRYPKPRMLLCVYCYFKTSYLKQLTVQAPSLQGSLLADHEVKEVIATFQFQQLQRVHCNLGST